ncbi:MAG: hypothetical protein RJA34_2237 [Pseudomonadota bacterium]
MRHTRPPLASTRRQLLQRTLALGMTGSVLDLQALSPQALQFPRDFGSHPELRTEWWYVTGQLQAPGRKLGFQVTFFRTRVDATQAMKSAFAAKQLLFAHAALTDIHSRHFLHDQRVAREGFGLALADLEDTRLTLRDWTLKRSPGDAFAPYETQVKASDFELALTLTPTQPVLLQGERGLSRKGPNASQASFYYSQPQLRVQGAVTAQGATTAVQGRAWLDHEWSESLLHPQAVGWDWIGMNLDDGSALTAFRLRTAQGEALWAGGSFRAPGVATRIFKADEVNFTPLRHWRSSRSGATYPVEWQVSTPAGVYTVVAALDEQELDSRNSTGAIYWEGLSHLYDPKGRPLGAGYLEMTGYAQALRL